MSPVKDGTLKCSIVRVDPTIRLSDAGRQESAGQFYWLSFQRNAEELPCPPPRIHFPSS